jgi:hypothetical protein
MAFPPGWVTGKGFPPPEGIGPSLRFRKVAATPNPSTFADNAYSFNDGETPLFPTPYVKAGSSDPVAFGDRSNRGAPLGGGQDPRDAALHLPFDATNQADPILNQQKVTVPLVYANRIWVKNLHATIALEISFDGETVHSVVPAQSTREYEDRREAGIAVRAAGGATIINFEIEAW